jgi:excisionase family DNA binding protein
MEPWARHWPFDRLTISRTKLPIRNASPRFKPAHHPRIDRGARRAMITRDRLSQRLKTRRALDTHNRFKQPVLKLREVADYLRLPPSSIYRLIMNKQLPAFKVGRDWRFSIEALDRWRAQLEDSGGSVAVHSENPEQRKAQAAG